MTSIVQRLSSAISETPFRCRPLAFLLAVLLCALLSLQISVVLFIIYVAGLFVYSLCAGIFKRGIKPTENPMPIFIAVAILIGTLLSLTTAYSHYAIHKMQGQRRIKAVITDVYYDEIYGSLYYAELKTVDGKDVSGYAKICFDSGYGLKEYDTVELIGNVKCNFDSLTGQERIHAKSKNEYVSIEGDTLFTITDEYRRGIEYNVKRLSNAAKERFYELLPSDTAGYACAIFLGDKSGLSMDFYSDMSALGISHILAVSGMHMSIIASIITILVNKSRVSRKAKSIAVILGAICFAAIAGFSPSVVRAGIMLAVGMLSVFAKGRADALTSLFVSGAIICALNPRMILSCSFLLSFFATLGIVLCALYVEKRGRYRMYSSRVNDMKRVYKIVRALAFSITVSLCATLFTTPVMSVYFSEVSVVSVLTNLIALPMASASMVLTLLTLSFGGIPYLGYAICLVFKSLYNSFERLVQLITDTFTTEVSLEYPFFVPCVILLLAMLVFLLFKGIRSPIAVICAFLTTAIIYGGGVQIYGQLNAGRCEIVYVAEENSEGFTLSSGSKTMYIDVGSGARHIPVQCVNIAKSEYYETELDAYMLTHYHSAHIGTFEEILRACEIKTLYLPIPQNDVEKKYCEYISRVSEACEIITYERGECIEFGDIEIRTLPYTLLERSTHPVIALNFTVENKSITYVGASVSESDACFEVEEFISNSGAVICGSHGPSVKENHPFLSFAKGSVVYLSPFEEVEEAVVFPNGKYTYLEVDEKSGFAEIRLSF